MATVDASVTDTTSHGVALQTQLDANTTQAIMQLVRMYLLVGFRVQGFKVSGFQGVGI